MTRRVEGERMGIWLAEEEMDVFGHRNAGVEGELVGSAGAFDDSFEDVFGLGGGEVGETMVTAEGDEVELASVLATFEAQRHGLILMAVRGERIVLPHDGPLMR